MNGRLSAGESVAAFGVFALVLLAYLHVVVGPVTPLADALRYAN